MNAVAVRPVRTTNAATFTKTRTLDEFRTRANTAGNQQTFNRRRTRAVALPNGSRQA